MNKYYIIPGVLSGLMMLIALGLIFYVTFILGTRNAKTTKPSTHILPIILILGGLFFSVPQIILTKTFCIVSIRGGVFCPIDYQSFRYIFYIIDINPIVALIALISALVGFYILGTRNEKSVKRSILIPIFILIACTLSAYVISPTGYEEYGQIGGSGTVPIVSGVPSFP